jgi:hypothetical protein
MKLELKNIKFSERQSKETNCFVADLYIDGKKVAYVENSGEGGQTNISPYCALDRLTLKEAEAYCKTLPDEHGFKMNLEYKVDLLFEDWLQAKSEKKLISNMAKGICVGDKNQYVLHSVRNYTIADLCKSLKGQEYLKNAIAKLLSENKNILNTNLPSDLFPKNVIKEHNFELENKQ